MKIKKKKYKRREERKGDVLKALSLKEWEQWVDPGLSAEKEKKRERRIKEKEKKKNKGEKQEKQRKRRRRESF